MSITYEYDQSGADHVDDLANKIDTSGRYVGRFKNAWATVSPEKGTEGIQFQFQSKDGEAQFTLYVQDVDGKRLFGMNFVDAVRYVLGTHKVPMTSAPGEIPFYDGEEKAWVTKEGETFPQLCDREVGLVLQRENYSGKGGERYRMNVIGVFQSSSGLTVTELKEGKTEPVKIKRMLKNLKDKDTRKPKSKEANFDSASEQFSDVNF